MASKHLRALVPRRPIVRILLLLVVAGAAIGIAGALFSGGETAARNPAIAETTPPPPGSAPATSPSPDEDTPDARSVVEEDSASDAVLSTTADDAAAPTTPDDSPTATTGTIDPPEPVDDAETSSSAAVSDDPPNNAPESGTDAGTGTAPVADAGDGTGTPEAAAPAETASPTNAAVDEPAASDAAAQLMERLQPLVAERNSSIPDYDRDYFAGWLDTDRDCVNTRHEILQAEAVGFSMNAEGCAVDSGEWFDPYTNRTFTDPRDLDVDHVVALADAWVSGAWEWADELLDRFSNDLGNLNAIAAGENRSKSAKGPAEYNPTAPAARCDYLVQYATVKIRWGLSITPQEIVDVLFQTVRVVLGFVGKPAADMIDSQHAVFGLQVFDQISPGETPGGIPVHHQQRVAAAFVNIVVLHAIEVEEPRFERIFVGERILPASWFPPSGHEFEDRCRERVDVSLGVCAGERDSQAGRVARNRWRANRGDKEAPCQQQPRDFHRRLRFAENERDDRRDTAVRDHDVVGLHRAPQSVGELQDAFPPPGRLVDDVKRYLGPRRRLMVAARSKRSAGGPCSRGSRPVPVTRPRSRPGSRRPCSAFRCE